MNLCGKIVVPGPGKRERGATQFIAPKGRKVPASFSKLLKTGKITSKII